MLLEQQNYTSQLMTLTFLSYVTYIIATLCYFIFKVPEAVTLSGFFNSEVPVYFTTEDDYHCQEYVPITLTDRPHVLTTSSSHSGISALKIQHRQLLPERQQPLRMGLLHRGQFLYEHCFFEHVDRN